MTRPGQWLHDVWFAGAPASRLALLRILTGGYSLWALRSANSHLGGMATMDPSLFEPVGIFDLLGFPLPPQAFQALLAATGLLNLLFIAGWKHRFTGPTFACCLLAVFTYASSWSRIGHTQNLLVLHVFVLSFTRSADALSADSWLSRGARDRRAAGWSYGWPIRLMCGITVAAYWLAGMAKVTSPAGFAWASDEIIRIQIAARAIEDEIAGFGASQLAHAVFNQPWLCTLLGALTLIVELGAPMALLNARLAYGWAASAYLMHWGIWLVMRIPFFHQLSGVLFAPFFPVERFLLVHRVRDQCGHPG